MKILKQEKGSIALFVIIAMLFFTMYLVGMYMLSANSQSQQIAETKKIKEIYEENVNNIDDVYQTLIENKTYYVKDSLGNSIPVPVGFSVITTQDQGNRNTGFVIKNDKDGNEFVWVPVQGNTYTYNRYALIPTQTEDVVDSATSSMKISVGTNYCIEKLPDDEKSSVEKYGGFYIGRYETGIQGYTSIETANSSNLTSWTGYKGGSLVVQKDKQVFNYITRDLAKEKAEKLYNKNSNNVQSKLCSSYAWDTTLKFIETKNTTYLGSSAEGWYNQSGLILAGKTIAVNNIYDMGGNAWEWTTENTTNTTQTVLRGGSYANPNANDYSASYREINTNTCAVNSVGFRIALYL